MNAQEAPASEAAAVRHLRGLGPAVRLHRRSLGAGDLHDLRRLRPGRLTCARTGSPTSACMAAPDGGCGYCGVPAAEAWARAEALDDERARLIVEGLT